MTPKQQAAKDKINKLAIELIALVNQTEPYSDADVSMIRDIALKVEYEANDLNDYEALERLFTAHIEPNPEDDGGIVDLLTAEDIECAE